MNNALHSSAQNSLAENNLLAVMGVTPAAALLADVLCDVDVSKGQLEGKAVCKNRDFDTTRLKMPVSYGALEGKLVLKGQTGKETITEVKFANG